MVGQTGAILLRFCRLLMQERSEGLGIGTQDSTKVSQCVLRQEDARTADSRLLGDWCRALSSARRALLSPAAQITAEEYWRALSSARRALLSPAAGTFQALQCTAATWQLPAAQGGALNTAQGGDLCWPVPAARICRDLQGSSSNSTARQTSNSSKFTKQIRWLHLAKMVMQLLGHNGMPR